MKNSGTNEMFFVGHSFAQALGGLFAFGRKFLEAKKLPTSVFSSIIFRGSDQA